MRPALSHRKQNRSNTSPGGRIGRHGKGSAAVFSLAPHTGHTGLLALSLSTPYLPYTASRRDRHSGGADQLGVVANIGKLATLADHGIKPDLRANLHPQPVVAEFATARKARHVAFPPGCLRESSAPVVAFEDGENLNCYAFYLFRHALLKAFPVPRQIPHALLFAPVPANPEPEQNTHRGWG